MKITAKQYGQYLYQITSDKSFDQSKLKDIIEKFVITLKNNNDLIKANSIVEQFVKIWNFENKIVEAEIISAKKIDIKIEQLLIDYIKEISKSDEIIIKKEIDQNLLGGVVVKYRDKVLDGSVKATLDELKNKLIK
ncbi:ATP synthase F1 subunit delta [Patescibacteria group bacterium]|nr:ATP synthase F1 subunit delta [Patescibacteria group bacterium]MBU1062697.1 ATP synthase F1 subunit delta [Patescibacteria group bacterium]